MLLSWCLPWDSNPEDRRFELRMSAELHQTGVNGAPRVIRTPTDRGLKPVPLPLGYWREMPPEEDSNFRRQRS